MPSKRVITKCTFIDVCYLCESLHCFGYKQDCVLFTPGEGWHTTREDFDRAVNALIEKTRSKQSVEG